MKLYKKYSDYLQAKFGQRVHKVSVNAGFSCPNKDGVRGDGGCIYCDNKSFNYYTRTGSELSLRDQIEKGMASARLRFKAEKFILYFQSNTNTYAASEILKSKYDIIHEFKDIVGLNIATRPDCVTDEILDLIKSYDSKYDVWIEYGLQSSHNKTLEFINRGHSYEDFLEACEMTRQRNIKVCAHVILGLPYEEESMILQTADELRRLKIQGIKIYPLYIIRGSKLEKIYKDTCCNFLDFQRYIDILAKFVARLDKETIVHSFSAYADPSCLVAPRWVSDKNTVKHDLEKIMRSKGLAQGVEHGF